MSTKKEVKFRVGKYRIPVQLELVGKRIFIRFPYNKTIISEIKSMEGARWHGFDDPPIKAWSVTNSQRNHFQLERLMEMNPYARYDKPLLDYKSSRTLYDHQIEMVSHALTRQYCIFGCEPGTGKSLAAIEVIEHLNEPNSWYVGPKAGVVAVRRELNKWNAKVRFSRMITYEGLVKVMKEWDGSKAPRVVVFDESHKIKTPTSQRSQAAMHLAEAVRQDWGDSGYVIEMTGTPSPKDPTDWWHQAEVACPGFLKEGNIYKFKNRLAVVEQRESISGGVYPHTVTWLDDPKKCAKCGTHVDDHVDKDHAFIPSKNEVEHLYKRLQGLVLIKLKKDCADLPEKQYVLESIKPTAQMLKLAKLIKASSSRAIEALTRIRELSDGFQYKEVSKGRKQCPACFGRGKTTSQVPDKPVEANAPTDVQLDVTYTETEIACDFCGGVGEIDDYERTIEYIGTPKEEAFKDDLDAYDEVGRLIVWGAFTGTVDRLMEIALEQKWNVLRVDGRGYFGMAPDGSILDADDLLAAMDASEPRYEELKTKYQRVCFVGQPEAGGVALTLTASPIEIFYSNSFNGTARMQAEERFHRMGMPLNRGCIVKDYILLPTDKLVLDNIQKKKDLQALTMGDIEEALSADTGSV